MVVRKQYHFWPGEQRFDAWDVDRLIALTAGFPVREVPVESVTELDTDYWFKVGPEVPTVRRIIDHLRLVLEVDPSHPIILGVDGRVMDGMHRVARAVLRGTHRSEPCSSPSCPSRTSGTAPPKNSPTRGHSTGALPNRGLGDAARLP